MIKYKKVILVYDSMTWTAIDPEFFSFSKEQIEDYMKEHPMPDDPAYSKQDLIYDLVKSSGAYTLPLQIKPETAQYVVDMLNELAE